MRIFMFLLGMLMFFQLQGQEPYYWQLTDEDGLPSMTVYNIQQDQEGYMWFGTAAGVCRYDGKEFKNYRHSEQVDDEIIYMEIDPYNRVWYANLSGQTFFIEKNKIKKVPELTDKKDYKMANLFVSKTHVILGHHSLKDKIDKNRGGKIILIKNSDSLDLKNINQFYSEQGFGDFETDDNKLIFTTYTNGSFVAIYSTKINTELEKNLITKRDKLNLSKNGGVLEFLKTSKTESILYSLNQIFYIYPDSKDDLVFNLPFKINFVKIKGNEIWMAGNNGGIFVFDYKTEEIKYKFFTNQIVNKFFSDSEGNIWFATQNSGVTIVPDFDKNLITKDNSPIKSHIPQTISKGFEKETIVGTKKGEVIFFNKEKIEKSKILPKPSAIYSIEPDKKNNRFLIGTNETILELSKNKYFVKRVLQSKITLAIKKIKLDTKNRLWVGNYDGCRIIENQDINQAKINLRSKRVVNNRTYAIHPDFEDNIWIGATNGLYQYTDTTLTPFLINGIHKKYYFTTITQSPLDSSIWASTHGNGVLQIKNNEVINHYKEENHLVSNICNDLFLDDYNHLWIATSEGLQKLDLKSNHFDLINKYDGLPTNEILNVVVNDSIVYIGTNKGIVTFPMDIKTKNTIAPPIHFTNFSILDKDTTLHDFYELNHDQRSIQIDFLGLAYKCRGDVQYKYRMMGIDTNWTTTDTRFARFPGLNKGDYEFQVVALNEDNVESEQPATMKIYIAPPYWETWWFRGGVFFLGVSLIGGFFNFRYKTIRRREKLEFDFQNQLNDLRAQALQTQMNPHFIFNSMNAIQHFLTMQDKENAMIYLARFAKLIRFIFDQSKQKTISLHKELEFLELYISLEKLRFQDKVAAKIDIDSSVAVLKEDIHLPPLLIQPVVENAFKHGLFHKKSKGNLIIKFSYHEPILSCIVEDDGVGREKSAQLNEWRKNTHTSSGIKATKERIELLNNPKQKSQSSIKENSFEIIDLIDQGQAIGTKVEIKLKNQIIYD